MGITTDLRRQIKSSFVPFMEAKGFSLDARKGPSFLIFRQTTSDQVYICDIQWDKYGAPRFIMNFGRCSLRNSNIGSAETEIADSEIHGRLQPRKGSSTRSWFRQDKPFFNCIFKKEKFYPPEKPVNELITLFSNVEAYWQSA